MKIEVLGTGCAGCRALFETTKQAVEQAGVEATILKEENLERIIAYGVMALPALVIDGRVVSSGRRLTVAEVRKLIER